MMSDIENQIAFRLERSVEDVISNLRVNRITDPRTFKPMITVTLEYSPEACADIHALTTGGDTRQIIGACFVQQLQLKLDEMYADMESKRGAL